MVLPLVALGLATLVVGWLVNPLTDLGLVPLHWFTEFVSIGPSHPALQAVHVEAEPFNVTLAIVTSMLAVAGIGLAYLMYVANKVSPASIGRVTGPAHRILTRKYYVDELYEDVITRGLFYGRLALTLDWLDKNLIDGVVRSLDRLGRNIGRAMAQVQTGQLQGYGTAISVGVLMMLGIYLVFR